VEVALAGALRTWSNGPDTLPDRWIMKPVSVDELSDQVTVTPPGTGTAFTLEGASGEAGVVLHDGLENDA
jgi:hypothetical protein